MSLPIDALARLQTQSQRNVDSIKSEMAQAKNEFNLFNIYNRAIGTLQSEKSRLRALLQLSNVPMQKLHMDLMKRREEELDNTHESHCTRIKRMANRNKIGSSSTSVHSTVVDKILQSDRLQDEIATNLTTYKKQLSETITKEQLETLNAELVDKLKAQKVEWLNIQPDPEHASIIDAKMAEHFQALESRYQERKNFFLQQDQQYNAAISS